MASPSNGKPETDLPATILDAVEVPPPPHRPDPPTQQSRVIASYSEMQWSGPMPHPGVLAKYEEACPGLASRIMKMAENESEHRRSCEAKVIDAQIVDMNRGHEETKRGQVCALAIVIVALCVSGFCVYAGHPVAGTILGGGSIGGIVTTFILGKKDEEPEKPPVPPSPKPGKRNRNKK